MLPADAKRANDLIDVVAMTHFSQNGAIVDTSVVK
jgi:hypothetical protein